MVLEGKEADYEALRGFDRTDRTADLGLTQVGVLEEDAGQSFLPSDMPRDPP